MYCLDFCHSMYCLDFSSSSILYDLARPSLVFGSGAGEESFSSSSSFFPPSEDSESERSLVFRFDLESRDLLALLSRSLDLESLSRDLVSRSRDLLLLSSRLPLRLRWRRFSFFSSLMCFSTFFSYSAFSWSISLVIWAILSIRVSDTFLPKVLYLGSSALLSSSKNFFNSLFFLFSDGYIMPKLPSLSAPVAAYAFSLIFASSAPIAELVRNRFLSLSL